MMYGILASLVPLAFMALIGFAAGRNIYMGLTLPKPLRGTDSAGVCGACHYPVTRGHGQICPECGRAHADAGILTPVLAKSMRPSASSVVAGWILLLLMCYIVAISVISVVISPTSVADERLVVTIALALAGLLVLVLIGLGVWSVARRNRIFAPPPEPARADQAEPDASRAVERSDPL